jgi:hypothetical protein
MDDAMILPCGHSFGGGGIHHVIRMVGSKPSKCHNFQTDLFCDLSTEKC